MCLTELREVSKTRPLRKLGIHAPDRVSLNEGKDP